MTKQHIQKTCEGCGQGFEVEPYRVDARFCSMACSWEYRKPRERKIVSVVCSQCGFIYEVEPWRLEKTSFCSKECGGRARMEARKIEHAEIVRASVPGKKKCIDCKEEKLLSEFHKKPESSDGLQHFCKSCHSLKCAKWRKDNSARKKELDKAYYENNREKYVEYGARYYEENKVEHLARNKEYVLRNKEKVNAASLQWREAHRDELRANRRQHYLDNKPSYVANARAREAHIKQATPLWADLRKIEAFYYAAELLTEETGIKHHVDHIYKESGVVGFMLRTICK